MRQGLLAAMVLALAACGGEGGSGNGGSGGGGSDTGVAGEEGFVNVTLEEQNGSGTSGTAILQPGAGSADVTLELMNAADGSEVHVHKGSCDSAAGDAEVEHDLGFVNVNLGQAILAVTIPEIATGEYYIDLHDAKDASIIDACGQIPEQ